ncbi:MAG: FAD-dependent oxidoreductase, partial [Clostridia bacterium]|nr:FAD-dependent oxidoreductase [Deltaproteobacteria bacterium]
VLNALDAARHGAEIRTYTEVVGITRDSAGAVTGARIRARGEATVNDVSAKVVVNCGGPWAEKLAGLVPEQTGVKLRPGKGVHLVYEKRLTNFAVITHAVDGREVFLMPYLNESWIGTTDDDFYGDLDDLSATQDEVAYLKEAVEHVLPRIKSQRLISTRIGVRNTMHGWGVHEDELSRGYKILDHRSQGVSNFFSLVGGKLASFRIQAEEAADAVCTVLKIDTPCRTHLDALPGGDAMPDEVELMNRYPVSRLTARRLIHRHGTIAGQVLEIGHETQTGYAIVDPNEPVLECELRYSIRNEMVHRLSDMPMRCRLGMGADQGMRGGLRAAQIFAEERGLDVTSMREELMGFLHARWRAARPVMTGQQLAQAELLMTQYTGLWQLPSLVPAG